jgi:hypothetical protein
LKGREIFLPFLLEIDVPAVSHCPKPVGDQGEPVTQDFLTMEIDLELDCKKTLKSSLIFFKLLPSLTNRQ